MSSEAPLTVEALHRLHHALAGVARDHPRKMLLLCAPGEQSEVLALFERYEPGVIGSIGAIGHMHGLEFELRSHNFCKPGHVIVMRHPDEWEAPMRADIYLLGGYEPGEASLPVG